jgi:hypothetical protein
MKIVPSPHYGIIDVWELLKNILFALIPPRFGAKYYGNALT